MHTDELVQKFDTAHLSVHLCFVLEAKRKHKNTSQHFYRKDVLPKATGWRRKRREFPKLKYSTSTMGR
jgi:hypothetical protein